MSFLASGDALSDLFRSYSTWVEGLSDDKITFLLRALLFFGLPSLIARGLFAFGNRQVGLQVLAVALGSLLAFAVPVDAQWFRHQGVRVAVVTLAGTALVFLPWVYSFYLVRRRRAQQQVRYAVYAILVVGFLFS